MSLISVALPCVAAAWDIDQTTERSPGKEHRKVQNTYYKIQGPDFLSGFSGGQLQGNIGEMRGTYHKKMDVCKELI